MRFKNINEYMQKDLSERQNHLDLSEECIEIGGYDSREYRGLLAHYLGTTIPTKTKIRYSACHKCGNHTCSNPKHMYWGTDRENAADMKDHGTFKSIYQRTLDKYGKEKTKEMQKAYGRLGGIKNKGKINLSEEKINFYKEKILEAKPGTYGWIARAQKSLGLSHTYIRKFYNKFLI